MSYSKPNLFIVGAPKSGTTAWVEYLGSHPDIYFPERKEPSFFCPDLLPQQRVQAIDEYLRLFEGSGSRSIAGEASVTYLRSEVAPAAIRKFNPEAKILIFLRDQEDFLPSLHNQLVFNGEELIEDFETAWRSSGKRLRENVPAICNDVRLLDYRAAGRFHEQIERYFGEFPAEQIRVFHFRDWVSEPRAAYREILRFLDLPNDGRDRFPAVNEARRRHVKLWLRLVTNPPPLFARAAGAVKTALGVSSLGVAERLLKIGARAGSGSNITPGLREEIREYYAADNALTSPRLWQPRKDMPDD